MELNEMEKKLLFQVEGDYQTKILNELYVPLYFIRVSVQYCGESRILAWGYTPNE